MIKPASVTRCPLNSRKHVCNFSLFEYGRLDIIIDERPALNSISVTMMSRLTLNLHNSVAHPEHINATTVPFSTHIISTLQFTTQQRLEEIDEPDEEYERAGEVGHGQA